MKPSIIYGYTFSFFAGSLLAGCSTMPRDANGSTDKILQSRILTVGVASKSSSSTVEAREKRIVEALARRLGAKVQYQPGNTHQLLDDLEAVKLPLVAAQIPSDTPFADTVGLSHSFLKQGPHDKDYCLAVAPGENRLLLMVDQVIAEETQ